MSKFLQRSGYVNCDEKCNYYRRHVERRIVLIGKTGTGKSSFGNAILGEKHFDNKGAHMRSNTTTCKIGCCKTKEGKDILVLDTPGLSDTRRPKEEIFEELCKCTTITSPGPHVFCLLIRCDERFTPECVATLDEFCSFFGEEIFKHLIVVFTHKKELDEEVTIDDCITCLPEDFQEKFSRYGGKVIGIESKYIDEGEREKQTKEFFTLMEEIITRNNGDYYSDKMFKAVEKALKEGEKKCQEKANKDLEATKEWLKSGYDKREQEILEREEKLKEEKVKLEHDMKLNEQVKKEQIESLEKMLEKETEKRVNAAKEYEKRAEDMYKKASQDLCSKLIEVRNEARKEAQETECFSDMAIAMVKSGVGAVKMLTGGITRAVGWFFKD